MRAIATFAHNEENKIITCLESIKKAIKAGDQCYVLNNGSTDHTGPLVDEFLKENNFCKLVTINAADKSNAWNVFVHDLGIEADIYCFLDGDCYVSEDSFDALESCIINNPRANAVAAVPADSVSPKNRALMLKEGGLAGNLYALPREFVERLRKNNVRLPFGLIGDDSLLGALAYWNLNPKANWDKSRIVVCEEAEFFYDRLSIFSLKDIRLYIRRKIRYSLRHFQTLLMKKPLKEKGLAAIPKLIDDLYINAASELKVTWRGMDTFFDIWAARMIRKNI